MFEQRGAHEHTEPQQRETSSSYIDSTDSGLLVNVSSFRRYGQVNLTMSALHCAVHHRTSDSPVR